MALPSLDPSSQEYKKARRLHLKTTKNRNPELELDWTPFRAAEKKYRARFPPPDLSNVLDLATLDHTREPEIQQGVWRGRSDAVEHKRLVATHRVKAFIVPRVPGTAAYHASPSSWRFMGMISRPCNLTWLCLS